MASVADAQVRILNGNSKGQAMGGFVETRGHTARCTWTDRKGSWCLAIAADVRKTTTESYCKDDEAPGRQVVPSPLWLDIQFDDPEDAARHSQCLYFLALFVLEKQVRNMVHPHDLILKRIAVNGAHARHGTVHVVEEEEARCCYSPPKVLLLLSRCCVEFRKSAVRTHV